MGVDPRPAGHAERAHGPQGRRSSVQPRRNRGGLLGDRGGGGMDVRRCCVGTREEVRSFLFRSKHRQNKLSLVTIPYAYVL